MLLALGSVGRVRMQKRGPTQPLEDSVQASASAAHPPPYLPPQGRWSHGCSRAGRSHFL